MCKQTSHDTYFSTEALWALSQETLYIRNRILYEYPRGLSFHYIGLRYIVVPSHGDLYREMPGNAQGDY